MFGKYFSAFLFTLIFSILIIFGFRLYETGIRMNKIDERIKINYDNAVIIVDYVNKMKQQIDQKTEQPEEE